MDKNQVFKQKLTVFRRIYKTVAGAGEHGQLSRPTYGLLIQSMHSPEADIHPVHRLGGVNEARIIITISRTMADALVQDHGAEWSDDNER